MTTPDSQTPRVPPTGNPVAGTSTEERLNAAMNENDDGILAWNRLLEEYGALTAAELAERKGTSGTSYARDLIHSGRALAVIRGRTPYMPGYQFDATGTLYPAVASVLTVFRDAGWSDFSTAIWLAAPSTWLSGERPAEMLAAEDAATRLMQAAWRTVHE